MVQCMGYLSLIERDGVHIGVNLASKSDLLILISLQAGGGEFTRSEGQTETEIL